MSNTIIQDRKVFCTDCAYFNSCKRSNARMQFDDENLHEICTAPQNIRATYMSDGSDKYISVPSIINKYNNCQWFLNACRPDDVIKVVGMHNKDPQSHPYILEKISDLNEKINEAGEKSSYELNEHLDDKSNPHEVTKAQVGLGNVDNTADIDKPISTAQKEAHDELDNKIKIETIRATAEEERIVELIAKTGGSVEAETERAMLAESKLQNQIDSVNVDLGAEVNRAKAVENAHQSSIDSLQQGLANANSNIVANTNSITNEITRATAAETKINADIVSLTAKTTSDIAAAKLECKQYAESQDTVTLNAAKSFTGEAKIDAITVSELYTDKVKAELEKEIVEKTKTLWKIKGSVNYKSDLDAIVSKEAGDIYIVKYRDDGSDWNTEFVWTEEGKWEELGAIIDLREYYKKVETDSLIAAAKQEAIDKATSLDEILHTTVTSEIATAKQEAINAAETKARQLDDVLHGDVTTEISTAKSQAIQAAENKDATRYTQVTNDIATAKSEAIKTAEDKDAERYATVTSDIATAKQEAIDEAETKDQARYTTVTSDIATSLASAKAYTDTAIEGIVGPGGKTIEQAIAESEQYADNKDVVLHNTITSEIANAVAPKANSADVYTKTETDNKDKEIKDTYLPLTGEKIVTGTVEFQKTLKVKDSVIGADTLTINTGSIVKTSNAGSPTVTLMLPEQSGVIARVAEFENADTALHTTVTSEIATAKQEAIKDAEDKNTALETKLTTSIATAKSEAIKDAEDKNDALETKLTKTINEATSGITASIADHILNTTDAHDIDNRLATAIQTSKNYADNKDTEKYNLVTSETDNKINEVKSTYLPLVGGKAVTGNVEFQKGIKVKDSIEGAETLSISTTSLVKSSTATGAIDIVYALPAGSGTLARLSDIDSVSGDITTRLTTAEGKIIVLENKVPSDITGTIVDTSVSTDKDVPNNYAVKTALALKANKTDVDTSLDTKANKNETYTKVQVDNLLDVKANSSDVNDALALKANKATTLSGYGITNAYTKDEVYTKEYLDTALTSKASTTYVNDQLVYKANAATTYTKDDVDAKLDLKADKSYVDGNFIKSTEVLDTYATKTELTNGLATKANIAYVSNAITEVKELISTGDTDTLDQARKYTDEKITGTYRVKPPVETFEDLPTEGNVVGDVRNVRSGTYAGANFVWTDTLEWDKLSETVDISGKQDTTTAVKHDEDTQVGNSSTPVYVQSNGQVAAINKDNAVTESSVNLITSGAVFNSLKDKVTTDALNTALTTKANVGDSYTKDEEDTKLGLKADKTYVDTSLATKANVTDVYTKTDTDSLLLAKADKSDTYNKAKVDDLLTNKADVTTVYTKEETDNKLNLKANTSDVYTKTATDSLITNAKNAAIEEAKSYAHAQDDAYLEAAKTAAHGYADEAKEEAYQSSKTYTDTQIASMKNRHYDIKTILPDESDPSFYKTFEYASNNIDLSGKVGDIYIYLPITTTALAGKGRELIVNISNRDVDNCIIHFATLADEAVTFRDGGVLETLSTKKSEFSLRFQEYDVSKFLVDEIGTGDTINNEKINITADQMTIFDNDGSEYKFVIVDGQLKVVPVA